MASRFAMMTDLFRHMFGEPCTALTDIGLDPQNRLTDRRIETLLPEARRTAAPGRALEEETWRASTDLPFVFA